MQAAGGLQVQTLKRAGARTEKVTDLVNGGAVGVKSESIAVRNVIGREKVLIQLESLILAQSERWRQA